MYIVYYSMDCIIAYESEMRRLGYSYNIGTSNYYKLFYVLKLLFNTYNIIY